MALIRPRLGVSKEMRNCVVLSFPGLQTSFSEQTRSSGNSGGGGHEWRTSCVLVKMYWPEAIEHVTDLDNGPQPSSMNYIRFTSPHKPEY